MDTDTQTIAFRAIRELVDDLWDSFKSKKVSPLVLYHRLIQHIKEGDTGPGIQKCVSGFVTFFGLYGSSLTDSDEMMKAIPRDVIIRYGTSKGVYLEIQKYLYQSHADDREVIRRHLLTISAILEPSEEALAELESTARAGGDMLARLGLDGGSAEGAFVSGIMNKAKTAMEAVDTDDPTAAIVGLLSSGIMTDMIQGLESGVRDGRMDMNKLLSSMQGAMSTMMPQPATADDATDSNVVALPDEEEEE